MDRSQWQRPALGNWRGRLFYRVSGQRTLDQNVSSAIVARCFCSNRPDRHDSGLLVILELGRNSATGFPTGFPSLIQAMRGRACVGTMGAAEVILKLNPPAQIRPGRVLSCRLTIIGCKPGECL